MVSIKRLLAMAACFFALGLRGMEKPMVKEARKVGFNETRFDYSHSMYRVLNKDQNVFCITRQGTHSSTDSYLTVKQGKNENSVIVQAINYDSLRSTMEPLAHSYNIDLPISNTDSIINTLFESGAIKEMHDYNAKCKMLFNGFARTAANVELTPVNKSLSIWQTENETRSIDGSMQLAVKPIRNKRNQYIIEVKDISSNQTFSHTLKLQFEQSMHHGPWKNNGTPAPENMSNSYHIYTCFIYNEQLPNDIVFPTRGKYELEELASDVVLEELKDYLIHSSGRMMLLPKIETPIVTPTERALAASPYSCASTNSETANSSPTHLPPEDATKTERNKEREELVNEQDEQIRQLNFALYDLLKENCHLKQKNEELEKQVNKPVEDPKDKRFSRALRQRNYKGALFCVAAGAGLVGGLVGYFINTARNKSSNLKEEVLKAPKEVE